MGLQQVVERRRVRDRPARAVGTDRPRALVVEDVPPRRPVRRRVAAGLVVEPHQRPQLLDAVGVVDALLVGRRRQAQAAQLGLGRIAQAELDELDRARERRRRVLGARLEREGRSLRIEADRIAGQVGDERGGPRGVGLAQAVEREHRVVGHRIAAHRVLPRRHGLGAPTAAQLGAADPVLRLAFGPVVVVDGHRGDLLLPVGDGLGVVAGAERAPAQAPQRLGAHVAGGERHRQRLEGLGDLGVVVEIRVLLGHAQERVVGEAVRGIGVAARAVARDRGGVLAEVRVRAPGLVVRAHQQVLVAGGGARGDRFVEARGGGLAIAGLEQALGAVVARRTRVGRRAIGRGQHLGVRGLGLGVAHRIEQRLGAAQALGGGERRLGAAGLGQRVQARGGLGGPRRQRIVDGDRAVERAGVGAGVGAGLERLGAAEPRLGLADAVRPSGQVVAVVRGDRGVIAGAAEQITDQQLGVGGDERVGADRAGQGQRGGGVVREVARAGLLVAEVVGERRQERAGPGERIGGAPPLALLRHRDAREEQRAPALGRIGGVEGELAEGGGGGGPVLADQRVARRRAGEVRPAHVLGERGDRRPGWHRRGVDPCVRRRGGGDRGRHAGAMVARVVARARRPREDPDEEDSLRHDGTVTTSIATGKFPVGARRSVTRAGSC